MTRSNAHGRVADGRLLGVHRPDLLYPLCVDRPDWADIVEKSETEVSRKPASARIVWSTQVVVREVSGIGLIFEALRGSASHCICKKAAAVGLISCKLIGRVWS